MLIHIIFRNKEQFYHRLLILNTAHGIQSIIWKSYTESDNIHPIEKEVQNSLNVLLPLSFQIICKQVFGQKNSLLALNIEELSFVVHGRLILSQLNPKSNQKS